MICSRGTFRQIFILFLFLGSLSCMAETWRLFEDSIKITEPVAGDAFLVANELTLSGTFSEDVWAAGRKIEFTGTAQDDVRMVGLEVVNLNGVAGGDVRLISQLGNVLLSSNAVVAGTSILQAGKRISISGKVQGDVWAEAPRIVVEGEISGDLSVSSKNIQLLPGTIIRGNLVNRGSQPVPVPDGVTVLGERLQEAEAPSEISQTLQQLKWMIKGIQFITAFLIGLLMLKFFPRFTGQNVDLLLTRQAPLVSIGLFSFLLMTLAGYFLLMTVIGSGLGLFLLLVTGLIFYLGKLFVAFLIGMLLLRQTTDLAFGKLALALIIGLAVLYTLSSIPYIGGSIYLLASCWGMGAMLVSLRMSQNAVHFTLPTTTPEDSP